MRYQRSIVLINISKYFITIVLILYYELNAIAALIKLIIEIVMFLCRKYNITYGLLSKNKSKFTQTI